jgi:hypothetical protein
MVDGTNHVSGKGVIDRTLVLKMLVAIFVGTTELIFELGTISIQC